MMGVAMSGPLRFRFAAVLVLAGFSTSPAFANILDTLLNRTPEEAAPPAPAKDAPAKDECLSRPGKPVDGQHWRYRLDGNRRCWFLGAEEAATSRQRVQRHGIKRRLAVSEEEEAAPRKRKAVVDARAELVRPAPEETLQPRPVPAMKVVDAAPSVPATGAAASVPAPAAAAPVPATGAAAPVPATGAAALVPPPPVLAQPDPLPPQRSDAPQDNVESLLAASPASSEAVAVSEPVVANLAIPIVTGEDGPWWTSRWFGPLLMALGLMSLLIAMRPVRTVAQVTRRVRDPEFDDRPGPSSDDRSHAHLQRRRPAPAMPHGARQFAERQRMLRASGPADPDISFQEAIRMLTDVDPASVGQRPGPVAKRPGAYAARRS
jgi:hypothetical protein